MMVTSQVFEVSEEEETGQHKVVSNHSTTLRKVSAPRRTAQDKRGHNNLNLFCTPATCALGCYTAKFVGRVDGKNLRVKQCFSKSAQIEPLNCIRNKWTCTTKQGLEGGGLLSINLPLSLYRKLNKMREPYENKKITAKSEFSKMIFAPFPMKSCCFLIENYL